MAYKDLDSNDYIESEQKHITYILWYIGKDINSFMYELFYKSNKFPFTFIYFKETIFFWRLDDYYKNTIINYLLISEFLYCFLKRSEAEITLYENVA